VDIGIREEDSSSEWASVFPSFAIPKKNETRRLFTDFRKFNLLLVHTSHPFPIPKIESKEMIRSMEGFTFASGLDLNMDYYHIKLDADAQKLCTIVFPREKYKYKRIGIQEYPVRLPHQSLYRP
jgi:hypothetical protein